jgi:hypothetical protein
MKSLEDVSNTAEGDFAEWENTERPFEPYDPYVELLRARADDDNVPKDFPWMSGPNVGRQQAIMVRLASRVMK